jgi:hypothetical protein
MDPKLFSSWVHRSLVLLKRGFERQTSSRWRFSRNNDWVVQVIPQQVIKAIRVLSTRKMVLRRQKLGWHFLLFTTALGLYGGVLWLWSGEFQGLILHMKCCLLLLLLLLASCFLLLDILHARWGAGQH